MKSSSRIGPCLELLEDRTLPAPLALESIALANNSVIQEVHSIVNLPIETLSKENLLGASHVRIALPSILSALPAATATVSLTPTGEPEATLPVTTGLVIAPTPSTGLTVAPSPVTASASILPTPLPMPTSVVSVPTQFASSSARALLATAAASLPTAGIGNLIVAASAATTAETTVVSSSPIGTRLDVLPSVPIALPGAGIGASLLTGRTSILPTIGAGVAETSEHFTLAPVLSSGSADDDLALFTFDLPVVELPSADDALSGADVAASLLLGGPARAGVLPQAGAPLAPVAVLLGGDPADPALVQAGADSLDHLFIQSAPANPAEVATAPASASVDAAQEGENDARWLLLVGSTLLAVGGAALARRREKERPVVRPAL